ncbi:MAG: FkbM family methyltransferase [Moorea sp. SIO2B7]|nr:FkbM family methyltransferase [Moorena sp. SIO2B7]
MSNKVLENGSEGIPFGVYWYYDLQYFLDDHNKLDIVFDIGAHFGETANTVIKYFPNSTIYSFEPVPNTFNVLTEKVKSLSQVKPFNLALGDKTGQIQMTNFPLCTTNTVLIEQKQKKSAEMIKDITTVNVDTVDHFCQREGINLINLLKIDTEGFEINVLKGAKQLLQEGKIDFILAECSFYQPDIGFPHGDFVEILNYLHPLQYRVVSFYTAAVDNLGWSWGDVLFKKITTKTSIGKPVYSVPIKPTIS